MADDVLKTQIEAIQAKVADGQELTPEEIQLVLTGYGALKEKLVKRNSSNWAATKERMEADPEFKAKVLAMRAKQQERQKAKRAADKEELATLRALYGNQGAAKG
jgi:Skp family chaperone for outer membrane proteins